MRDQFITLNNEPTSWLGSSQGTPVCRRWTQHASWMGQSLECIFSLIFYISENTEQHHPSSSKSSPEATSCLSIEGCCTSVSCMKATGGTTHGVAGMASQSSQGSDNHLGWKRPWRSSTPTTASSRQGLLLVPTLLQYCAALACFCSSCFVYFHSACPFGNEL